MPINECAIIFYDKRNKLLDKIYKIKLISQLRN